MTYDAYLVKKLILRLVYDCCNYLQQKNTVSLLREVAMKCLYCSEEIPDNSSECPFCHKPHEAHRRQSTYIPNSGAGPWMQTVGWIIFVLDIIVSFVLFAIIKDFSLGLAFAVLLVSLLLSWCIRTIIVAVGTLVENSSMQVDMLNEFLMDHRKSMSKDS